MASPVPVNTPVNNLISGTTSGSQTRTPGAGETAIVVGAVSAGGAGLSVSGAGATWTRIQSVSDGTRTLFVYRGENVTSGSSQTVTVSFSANTTCRWMWVAVTGISATTPDDQTGTKTTASSTRTSSDCVATAITTPSNVLAVCAMAGSVTFSSLAAPAGFTRVTGASGSLFLAYGVFAAGLSADPITVTYSSATASTLGGAATFNGDDQGGAVGQPYGKRLGGIPHNGFRRRGMF